jgi:hypothetical protein
LWGDLKDKVYPTNPLALEELRKTSAMRFEQFPEKELQ